MPALLTRMSRRPNASHLGQAGLDLLLGRHVHGDAHGPALRPAELYRSCVGAALVEIGDGDPGTLAHEGAGDLLADAAGGTGDDGDTVLETHGGAPFNADGREIDLPKPRVRSAMMWTPRDDLEDRKFVGRRRGMQPKITRRRHDPSAFVSGARNRHRYGRRRTHLHLAASRR
jgi:hypothetical protein